MIAILKKIEKDDLKDMDIKKMKGFTNRYRLSTGKIRIIFEKENYENKVIEIDFRGNIY